MAVYNGEKHLKAALESLLDQTYAPIEIIVIDDGSQDLTGQIAQSFGSKVRYFSQENRGQPAATNTGISMARGTYIGFLDADDLYLPEKVALQVEFLDNHPQVDMVFGHVEQFLSSELPLTWQKKWHCPKGVSAGYLAGSGLFRKGCFDRVGYFDEEQRIGVFIDWYMRAQEKECKYALLENLVLQRRIHENNMGIQSQHLRLEYLKIIKKALVRRSYAELGQKLGEMARRRPDFEPGEADAEAAKLKKFSDAGGSQKQWLPDAARTQVFGRVRYMLQPSKKQLELLHACLSSDRRAWQTWSHDIEFDAIDPASYRLLPLVSRNPVLQDLNEPIFEKCKGIYRRTWVSNKFTWAKILSTLNQLLDGGVDELILLKGIAMILHFYRDFGVRVIGDIDILVKKEKVALACAILKSNGWLPNVPRFDVTNIEHLKKWHALNFTHPSGLCIDLHWSFIQENCPVLDKSVWDNARNSENRHLKVPSPTDLLLQACIHGTKYSPIPLIRWIPDAIALLKTSEIDFERLGDLARKAHICLPISLALRYLAEQFHAPIPQNTLEQLEKAPLLKLEKAEYRFNTLGYLELGAWARYCLNRGYLTKRSRILHLFSYLQTTARLKSPWQIPFFAIYWVVKQSGKFLFKKINTSY